MVNTVPSESCPLPWQQRGLPARVQRQLRPPYTCEAGKGLQLQETIHLLALYSLFACAHSLGCIFLILAAFCIAGYFSLNWKCLDMGWIRDGVL